MSVIGHVSLSHYRYRWSANGNRNDNNYHFSLSIDVFPPPNNQQIDLIDLVSDPVSEAGGSVRVADSDDQPTLDQRVNPQGFPSSALSEGDQSTLPVVEQTGDEPGSLPPPILDPDSTITDASCDEFRQLCNQPALHVEGSGTYLDDWEASVGYTGQAKVDWSKTWKHFVDLRGFYSWYEEELRGAQRVRSEREFEFANRPSRPIYDVGNEAGKFGSTAEDYGFPDVRVFTFVSPSRLFVCFLFNSSF